MAVRSRKAYCVICVVKQCGRFFFMNESAFGAKSVWVVCDIYPDDVKPLTLSHARQIKVNALSCGTETFYTIGLKSFQ